MRWDWNTIAVVAALLAFNLPILCAAIGVLRIKSLGNELGKALKEKDSAGDPTEATSYSRITGAIGAIMLGSLFWVISNIAVALAILNPHSMTDILSGAGKLFLIGAALFLPYAFNQLKSVLQ